MSYFPFFVEISNKNCLIIGGGKIAYAKAKKLSEYGCKITVCAMETDKRFEGLKNVSLKRRKFLLEDLENIDFVVCACGDKQVDSQVFSLCIDRKIPVNTVDDIKKSTFIFPASARINDVSAAVCTSGKSPLYSKIIIKKVIKLLKNTQNVFGFLSFIRPIIKKNLTNYKEAKQVQVEILQAFVKFSGKRKSKFT